MKKLIKLQWNFSSKVYLGLGLLLFIASAPLPYGFYTFTRIIICGFSLVLFYQNFNASDKKSSWAWFFLFLAVLFNPLIVIHMQKEVWTIIDIILGLFFVFLAYQTMVNNSKEGK